MVFGQHEGAILLFVCGRASWWCHISAMKGSCDGVIDLVKYKLMNWVSVKLPSRTMSRCNAAAAFCLIPGFSFYHGPAKPFCGRALLHCLRAHGALIRRTQHASFLASQLGEPPLASSPANEMPDQNGADSTSRPMRYCWRVSATQVLCCSCRADEQGCGEQAIAPEKL
jgi:hypothetical protein